MHADAAPLVCTASPLLEHHGLSLPQRGAPHGRGLGRPVGHSAGVRRGGQQGAVGAAGIYSLSYDSGRRYHLGMTRQLLHRAEIGTRIQ